MTNLDNTENVSIFSVLGFIPNPENSETNSEGKVTFLCSKFEKTPHSDVIKIGQKLCGIEEDEDGNLRRISGKPQLNRQEASRFASIFGVPEDEKERKKFENLDLSGKLAYILNKLAKRPEITSFTEIM